MRLRVLRSITADLPTKGMALVVALVLWGSVTLLGTRVVTVSEVPVAPINLPADLGVSGGLSMVSARLRVPRTLSEQGHLNDLLHAIVDLSGSGLGERAVLVSVTATDSRIEVLGVTPATLRVTLDPIVERTIAVRVIPTGSPADGYRLGDVRADPPRVQVRGPIGLLERLTAIDARVPIDGAASPFDGDVSLEVPEGVSVAPVRVRVALAVEQVEETKSVGIHVVTRGSPTDGFWVKTVTTDPTTVVLKGPRELLDLLMVADTAPVDISDARASVQTPALLVLPDGVAAVGDPRLTVRVEIAPLEGTKDVAAGVTVTDVPDGLRVGHINPPTLRVAVRGAGSAFDRLREEDVRVVVSAAGKESGTFTVASALDLVRIPAGVRAVSVEQRSVSVALEGS